jgi:hypothetical protein
MVLTAKQVEVLARLTQEATSVKVNPISGRLAPAGTYRVRSELAGDSEGWGLSHLLTPEGLYQKDPS